MAIDRVVCSLSFVYPYMRSVFLNVVRHTYPRSLLRGLWMRPRAGPDLRPSTGEMPLSLMILGTTILLNVACLLPAGARLLMYGCVYNQ